MTNQIDQSVLDKLCSDLSVILDAELARGNVVNETSASWGLGGGTVWLLRRSTSHTLPSGVKFQRLRDPHDGYAEFVCHEHKQLLIAGNSA